MNFEHGGNIYSYIKKYEVLPFDFSSNINPFGMPRSAKEVLAQNISEFEKYPDPFCHELREKIGEYHDVDSDYVFCGNGASDIIFRLIFALNIKKALIPVPTFSEYEKTVLNVGGSIEYFYLKKENGFVIDESIIEKITKDIDIICICNPNNPIGNVVSKDLMKRIIKKCRDTGTFILADESFIEFAEGSENLTLRSELKNFDKLIVLRAFTKMYAMAGLRLGYCLCFDRNVIENLYNWGSPWNVSAAAQKCGSVVLKEFEYRKKTVRYIKEQREYLENGLRRFGFEVFESKVNFILFENNIVNGLKEELEKYGVIIRNCREFKGLSKEYFRIAVKSGKENEYLLYSIKKIIKEMRI